MIRDDKYYEAVRLGVMDAVLAYADGHCISFPTAIEEGVKAAVLEYLESGGAEAIKRTLAKELREGAPPGAADPKEHPP